MIEVDVETGKIEFLRYAAVHDAGTIVNPRTLDGQVIGGTVQGLGTALYEEILYDDPAASGTRVRALPSSVVHGRAGHHGGSPETPSPYTPYGIKGAGEAAECSHPRS